MESDRRLWFEFGSVNSSFDRWTVETGTDSIINCTPKTFKATHTSPIAVKGGKDCVVGGVFTRFVSGLVETRNRGGVHMKLYVLNSATAFKYSFFRSRFSCFCASFFFLPFFGGVARLVVDETDSRCGVVMWPSEPLLFS